MKTKRMTAGLLIGAMTLSMLTACGGKESTDAGKKESTVQAEQSVQSAAEESTENEAPQNNKLHTLTIRDSLKCEKMTARFFNTMSDAATEMEMTRSAEQDDCYIYTCQADTSLYNMVHLTYGENPTCPEVAFNSFVAGWYLKKDERFTDDLLLPYYEGADLKYDPSFETKVFQFDGYDKNVYIWTPADYDAQSAEKYSTIYLFDGQSMLTTGRERDMDNDKESWNVAESVSGMMSVTDNKAIVVCIATREETRENELVPDIGELAPTPPEHALKTNKHGNAFADFVCDTVIPYVQQNYNVYTDADHTALAGSSLGGLETFYTVLSHPDKFGTGGVMSATFGAYESKVWAEFLKDKLTLPDAPFLYIYAGSYGYDNGDVTEEMYGYLLKNGYPKDRMVYEKYEPGTHYMIYWRNIFSEFLQAVFNRRVDALECGISVKYTDRTQPDNKMPREIPVDPDDPALLDKKNFVYFDNSQTKWENVYAYWWGDKEMPTNMISGGLYLRDWPGERMEQIEGTDIYRVVAPVGVTNIIFDSGVTDAEVIRGAVAFQTADLPFDPAVNAGQVFAIDMSQPAKPDPGKFKTKSRYPSGTWSDYNG